MILRFFFSYFLISWVIQIVIFLSYSPIYAQVSPQSGNGKLNIWGSVQVEQNISKKWNYSTVLGYSRRSALDSYNITQFFGVFSFRNEFSYHINKKYKIAFGSFYSQIGNGAEFYDITNRLELRFYSRIIWDNQFRKFKLSLQLRPELRFFLNEGYYQIRPRLLAQFIVPLDSLEKHTLVFGNEILIATDRYYEYDKYWTPIKARDFRTTLFYRRKINPKLTLDIGYMNQLRFPLDLNNPRTWAGFWAIGLSFKNLFQSK